jgi:hypothetical protein
VDEVERSEPSPQSQEQSSPSEIPESSAGDGSASKSSGDTGGSAEAGNQSPDAGSQVMGRLPRTRPQRRSGRRPTATVKKSEAKPKPSPSTGARPSATTGARRRATASTAPRSRPAASRRRPAETATRTAARKRAPGAPQFALDLALGAAKLPLKVTADVTRRATHLIGRGLRLR